jgi:diguanylate cyclase (GGDEF)-like protein
MLVSKIRKNFKIDLIRPYRILLLDDQALVGDFYKTLLEDEGVEVLAISEAESIMAELESFHPDVFLLDMHMPNINGLEVAKLLRQQTKYDYIPIIFLTADDDINTKLEVLQCGADDVIPKNTPPKLIVQQVDSRIQRGQEIRYLASRDSLTGVFNHGQIMDAAAHSLRLSLRQDKPTIIVMIDLDNFKNVNDKYGHLAGDKVLISLGQLLLQSVRDTDYVGRYGGEEFMVVFSDANPSVIESKINSILASFLQIDYTVAKQVFHCSFSAGLASSTNYEKLSELISSADAALYKAKNAGRSRICVD